MQKIKQLPPHEAQKIAAGEVVERPANLLKELIENSLDAGADAITLYIEQAGKSLIRVIDNGSGMSPEDAKICFHQHATSKISSVDELTSIKSFGFRGEALASVAAVAKVMLVTKETVLRQASDVAKAMTDTQDERVLGIKLEIEKNQIINEESIGANPGTDIAVKDIFYNVPARKKFLKKDETEWRQISQLFNAFCLAHPNVHFKIFHDTRLIHNCPPVQTIAERASQLWDRMVQDHLISLAHDSSNTISVNGVITNHHFSRYDRNLIYLFVNNRWVKNYELSRALMKGYMNVLQPGKFPAAALFITIPPETVDINIHPRKEEVNLLHPVRVARAIQEIIKKALEEHVSAQIKKPVAFSNEQRRETMPMYDPQNFPDPSISHAPPITARNFPLPEQFNVGMPKASVHPTPSLDQSTHQQPLVPTQAQKAFTGIIIGQVHKTYILIDKEDGLYVVDQHAAHERILYELFSKRFDEVAMIQLAFPQTIEFPESDLDLLAPYLEILIQSGIAIERFGSGQLLIKATPVHCKRVNLKELIGQMIGWIHQESNAQPDEIKKGLNERLHAQMACKAAIKAGDILTHEQMKQLLDDLEKTPSRFSCPHGRPTGWMLSWHDVEKKFKRKL